MTRPRWDVVFHLFLSSSPGQKKRAALTIAAIAWGTLALLMLLAFGEGLRDSLTTARAGMGQNLAIIWPGETTLPWKGLAAGRSIVPRIDDLPAIAARVNEIDQLVPEVHMWQTSISYNGKTLVKRVSAVTAAYGEMRNQIALSGGRFINVRDDVEQRRVAFFGDVAAREFFGAADPVGKVVMIDEVPYTVIGAMKHKVQMGNYSGPDDDRVVIPMSTAKAQFGLEHVNNIVMRPKSPELMRAALDGYFAALSAKYGFDPQDKGVVDNVWDTVKTNKIFNGVILGITGFLAVMGTLTLLVGGVGVANIMYAVVKERTREIGVKMALGARPGWITGPLVLESLAYTLVGGLLGLVMSMALIMAIGLVPTNGNQALEFLGKPQLSLATGVGAAMILGLVGLLAGYIPARRAASVDPAETLRYE